MIRNGLLKEAEEQMLNVLSRDEKSFCLLLESAWDREGGMFSLVSTGLSLLLARRKRKEVEGTMHNLFMLPGGRDPGRMASVILIGRNT